MPKQADKPVPKPTPEQSYLDLWEVNLRLIAAKGWPKQETRA